MRKIVESKTGKLIISILISLILFNFIVPTYSHASEEWYGKLIEPLADLTCSVGDGIMNLMQSTMIPGSPKAVTRRSLWDQWSDDGNMDALDFLGGFFGSLATGGTASSVTHIALGLGGAATGAATGAAAGAAVGTVLPGIGNAVGFVLGGVLGAAGGLFGYWAGNKAADGVQEITKNSMDLYWGDTMKIFKRQPMPMIMYTPIAIFSNRIPALDVNFLNPTKNIDKQYDALLSLSQYDSAENTQYKTLMEQVYGINDEAEQKRLWSLAQTVKECKESGNMDFLIKGGEIRTTDGQVQNISGLGNSAAIIGPIISKWYVALRNISITGLMIVLLYIGIRILISSAGDEKARYKTMLKDWLVGFILVFFIHYIMVALLTITDAVTDMLSSQQYIEMTAQLVDESGNIVSAENAQFQTDNLFNTARILEARARDSEKEKNDSSWIDTFGYAVIYLVMVFYTLVFTFKFLKRVVYMAFLTVIAPMVALTYPIDKINDKRAQAFGYWFKEYTFNLLIAPIDLLLYIVLISSALEFAQSNILYALVTIGFILEAEDIIRTMFGVRAEGGAFKGGFTAGALFSSGLHMLDRIASGTKGLIKGSDNDKNSDEDNDDEKINDPNAETGMQVFNRNNNEEEIPQLDEPSPEQLEKQEIEGRQAEREQRRQEIEDQRKGIEDDLEGAFFIPDDYQEDLDRYDEELAKLDEEDEEDRLRLAELDNDAPADIEPEDLEEAEIPEALVEGEAAETPEALVAGGEEEQPNRSRRVIRGVKKAGRMYLGRKVTDFKKAFKTAGKKGGEIGLKAGIGIVGAATLGTIGLATGLVSKEGVSEVAKHTTAGMATGAAIGGIGANIATKGAGRIKESAKRIKKDYEVERYTPEERRERRNARLEKEFYKDEENIRYYKDKWGAEKYKEKMDQALEMKKHGIEEQNQIDKALKLREKVPELTTQEAATAVKMAENTTENKLRNLKDRREIMESSSAVIHNEKDRDRFMRALDQYYGINEKETKAYNDQVKQIQKEEKEQQERLEKEKQEKEKAEQQEKERNDQHNQEELERNTREQQIEEKERNKDNKQENFIDPKQKAEAEDVFGNNDD